MDFQQFDNTQIEDEVNSGVAEDLSNAFTKLAQDITDSLPECRQRSLAMTALEESYLWVRQTIALNQDVL